MASKTHGKEIELTKPKLPLNKRVKATIEIQWQLMLMTIPFIVMIIIFNYVPLWGWTMAFQRYRPNKAFSEQQWVGFENFVTLFKIDDFTRVIKNTLAMSLINLTLNTVGAIILALSLNEVRNNPFKRTVQTISYLPHFLSWVVAASLVSNFLASSGSLNNLLMMLNIIDEPILFLQDPKRFWGIIGFSSLWKEVGWNSIIYLSAITNIDVNLYEAAEIDGCGRWRKMRYITIPGISSTIVILLIMNVGWILNAGFEQQYLLQRGPTQLVAETIDIYTLKWGLGQGNYSLATAAGIFKSVVSIILITIVNQISKRFEGETIV